MRDACPRTYTLKSAMPETVTRVRVFVASPGDVADERDALDAVAEDLSHTFADEGVTVEVKRWERDTYPAMGRPQALVNERVGAYDVFVGIMWKRFGTPTGEAASGTEEEFNLAYERWQETGRPPILFFFREEPFYPRTTREIEQFGKVQAFREELQGRGLIGTYDSVQDFERKVRRALDRAIRDVLADGGAQGDTAGGASGTSAAPPSPLAVPDGAGVDAEVRGPRFSDIPLPQRRQQASDLDKHRFIRDGFATIASYFEDAAEALRQSDPALDMELDRESSRAFRATAFEDGAARSGCRIWISDTMGAETIAYLAGGGLGGYSDNAMNDYVRVVETDDGLAFALSGMDTSTRSDEIVDAEGTARHFWTRFVRPLDDAGPSGGGQLRVW